MTRPPAARRWVSLPFRNLGTRGRVQLDAVRIDGREVPVGPGPRDTLDLFAGDGSAQEHPTVLELDLAVELPVELREVLGHDERVPGDVRVVAIAEDPTTWYRVAARLKPDVPPLLRGTLRIERRAVDRAVTVRAVVCRGTAAADPRPDLPAVRGARLLETLPLTLQLRSPASPAGSFLAVRWRAFSTDPALAPAATQPWMLQLSDPPVLWLNQDLEDLAQLLRARATAGRQAHLRDLVLRSIGVACWPVLFHAAAGALGFDDRGEPVYAADWHRDALAVLADWLHPDLPRPQQLGRLLALIADARTHPEHLEPLLEDVVLGTLRGVDVGAVVARALDERGD